MTTRDRIMITVIAVVAVVAAAWMLAIKPKREDASALADSATQAQTRRDTALATLANAQQARANVSDAKVGIARMGKAVPPDQDAATILYQLERTAKRAGIDFRSVSLEAVGTDPTPTTGPGTGAVAGAGLNKIPIKLKFDGSFKNLRKFLGELNSLTTMRDGKYVSVRGRLFSAEGVSLAAGRGGFPALTANINAVAYTAEAPKTDAAAAAAATAPGTSPEASDSTTASTNSTTGVAAE